MRASVVTKVILRNIEYLRYTMLWLSGCFKKWGGVLSLGVLFIRALLFGVAVLATSAETMLHSYQYYGPRYLA